MTQINIPRPQRNDKGRILGEFYPLQRAELLALRDSDLARGPFYVHLCMRFENPWCDRSFAVSVTQFCKRWHIPESNFYRSIGKLQEMQILDWEPREIFFYWKSPTSENQFPLVGDSPSSGSEIPTSESNSPSNGSEIPTSESNSPSSENLRSPESLSDKDSSSNETQIIQTTSDSYHTYPESQESEKTQKETNLNTIALLSVEPKSLHQTDKPSSGSIIPSARADKFFTGLQDWEKSYLNWAKTVHPALVWAENETPWLEPPTRNQRVNFHKAMLEWHGRRWMQQFNKPDLYAAIADFRSSLLNNPDKIAGRWDEYQSHHCHKLTTTTARINAGINVAQSEMQQFAKHQRAFSGLENNTTVVVDDKVLAAARTDIKSIAPEREIDWSAISESTQQWETEQVAQIPEGAENPQAYINTVKPEDSDFWQRIHEQQQSSSIVPTNIPTSELEARNLVAEAIANIKPMPKFSRAERHAQTRLQHWNNLLQTNIPSVITDVERQVKAAGLAVVDGCVVELEG